MNILTGPLNISTDNLNILTIFWNIFTDPRNMLTIFLNYIYRPLELPTAQILIINTHIHNRRVSSVIIIIIITIIIITIIIINIITITIVIIICTMIRIMQETIRGKKSIRYKKMLGDVVFKDVRTNVNRYRSLLIIVSHCSPHSGTKPGSLQSLMQRSSPCCNKARQFACIPSSAIWDKLFSFR